MHDSLWFDTLDADDALVARPSLPGDTDVDVAIVGAGLTGLWTAYYLRLADPLLRIAVLEANIAGFGASGRNGGWCSALLPMDPVSAPFAAAMRDTVREVGRQAAALGIECGWKQGGWVQLARNSFQLERVRQHVRELRSVGDVDARELSAGEATDMVNATAVLGASFTPHCAAVHPGRLVRGLANRVEQSGTLIFEGTRVTSLEQGSVRTLTGTVRADVVVRATEGFTAQLAGHRRNVVPLYSLMIATDVLSADQWDHIGLHDRPTFSDARHLVIYGQRTADGRLAFGGRGAPYHFGSAIRPEFDRHIPTHHAIRNVLVELFPCLATTAISHQWGGPLGVARDWTCSVGFDSATGSAWAGGYVGDGVATTNLAGRTLADLITRRDTELTALAWVNHVSPKWEPEPFRWLGINAAARLPERADRRESAGHSGGWSERMLKRLTS